MMDIICMVFIVVGIMTGVHEIREILWQRRQKKWNSVEDMLRESK
jgi:hypothetical protein